MTKVFQVKQFIRCKPLFCLNVSRKWTLKKHKDFTHVWCYHCSVFIHNPIIQTLEVAHKALAVIYLSVVPLRDTLKRFHPPFPGCSSAFHPTVKRGRALSNELLSRRPSFSASCAALKHDGVGAPLPPSLLWWCLLVFFSAWVCKNKKRCFVFLCDSLCDLPDLTSLVVKSAILIIVCDLMCSLLGSLMFWMVTWLHVNLLTPKKDCHSLSRSLVFIVQDLTVFRSV